VLGVWQGSQQSDARLLPAGVSLAQRFRNLGAEILAGDEPVDCDVLVCSNDEKAKQVASELVGKIPGARALNGGKLENARIVESLTALLIGLNMRYKVHGAGIRFNGATRKDRRLTMQDFLVYWKESNSKYIENDRRQSGLSR